MRGLGDRKQRRLVELGGTFRVRGPTEVRLRERSRAAPDHIHARLAEEQVVAHAANEEVIARAAEQDVVTAAAEEIVRTT